MQDGNRIGCWRSLTPSWHRPRLTIPADIKIRVFDANGLALFFLASNEQKSSAYRIEGFQLEKDGHQAVLSVDDDAFQIPKAFVEDRAGIFHLKSAKEIEELADDLLIGALVDLREELSERRIKIGAGAGPTFFGAETFFSAAMVNTKVRIQLPRLAPGGLATAQGGIVLAAHAEAAIFLVPPGAANPVQTRAVLSIEVREAVQRPLEAGIEIVSNALSSLDLRLPRVPLPELSLGGIDLLGGSSFRPFAVPVPNLELEMVWSTPPRFRVLLTGRALAIETDTAGSGGLQLAGTEIATIDGFRIRAGGGQTIVVEGTVAPIPYNGDLVSDKTFEVGPFLVRVAALRVELAPTGTAWEMKAKLVASRVELRARSDPSLVLALLIEVEIAPNGGRVETEITKLWIIEPYPLELVLAAGKAIGALVRLVAAIPAPGMTNLPEPSAVVALLERIAALVGAALRWLVGAAGEIARMLAGVAEAVAELLERALRLLLDAANTALTHVVIEVRLDPRDFHLRQIAVMPAGSGALAGSGTHEALGLRIDVPFAMRPALLFDFDAGWCGLFLWRDAAKQPITLSTDLWMTLNDSRAQAARESDDQGNRQPTRLLQLDLSPKIDQLGLVTLQGGKARFLQKLESQQTPPSDIHVGGSVALAFRESSSLSDVGPNDLSDPEAKLRVHPGVLPFLRAPKHEKGSDGFLDRLGQYVRIKAAKEETAASNPVRVAVEVTVVVIKDRLQAEARLELSIDLYTLRAKLGGGDRIGIRGQAAVFDPFGLKMTIEPRALPPPQEFEMLVLDFRSGDARLSLSDEARMKLSYERFSTEGPGLQFDVDEFVVSRGGLDLSAKARPDPVRLSGINVPFRFTSGGIRIRRSRLIGGSLTGSGQLPPALVGEANATISIALAERDGQLVIEAAEAKLDKTGDPIVCESTRFVLTITELGIGFVERGGYHFFFLLTGSAEFRPAPGEFESGLLKHLADVKITLRKAPLAGDARVLAKAIEFQVKVEPPKRTTFFDLFTFELRGIGFHPAAEAFGGDPALSISGQVNFAEIGDVVSPRFDFHQLWIAPPASGSALPRVRFDGLTVGVSLGATAQIEATAIAVDDSLPTIYVPGTLPANVTANGFLAAGRLSISGWASMAAAMGFLELRDKLTRGEPKHAFFLYGQLEKLSQAIPTPVGTLYLREAGFGFGYRFTLAGIAEADKVSTPSELVRVLDDVSKYQGNLADVKAWQPTLHPDLTLAMRAMFSITTASTNDSWNEREVDIPNPLLFDVAAALRTDLTFLMTVRAWIAVNYADWFSYSTTDPKRSQPTLRGYLYLSVPRREFLGRFLSDPTGFIGKHPDLPAPLVSAFRNTRFSSTLYIRPGLFHAELGWPYELQLFFGKKDGPVYLACSGGVVFRIEDGAMLYGVAFRAVGHAHFTGKIGGRSFGASAEARADFALEAKFLAYVSARSPKDTMFYGSLKLDVTVSVAVRIWLELRLPFDKKIHLEIGFRLSLSLSIAVELVIMVGDGIGGRARAAIGVRGFGRSLKLGVGFSFNDDLLVAARARVERFMALGLGVQAPTPEQVGERAPLPESSRGSRADRSDTFIDGQAENVPAPFEEPEDPRDRPAGCTEKVPTDFWAMLFPTQVRGGEEWYVMQLVPRDLTGRKQRDRGTFFSPPRSNQSTDHDIDFGQMAAAPDALWRFPDANSAPVQVIHEPNGYAPLHTTLRVGAVVDVPELPDLTLGQFLEDLYMGKDPNTGELTEPTPPLHPYYAEPLPDDETLALLKLRKIAEQRAELGPKARVEAEVEERRSAFIGSVCEGAGQVAERGGTTGSPWGQALKVVDPRDLGLTFLVSRDALNQLFAVRNDDQGPPIASSTIRKRTVTAAGQVHLFNPPDRMFRIQNPRLEAVTLERQASGIAVNWNLEPTWGRSKSLWDDPEFHLKHYRIQRRIQNAHQSWLAEFVVKSGAPAPTHDDPLLAAALQFVDDLSVPSDFPRAFRDHLLGRPFEPGEGERWRDFTDLDRVEIHYSVVPVDTAGTSGLGIALPPIAIDRPTERLLPIKQARSRFVYKEMPVHGVSLAPEIWIETVDPDLFETKTPGAPESVKNDRSYHLRVRRNRASPSGLFGSDSLSEARSRPDELEMDRNYPEDDRDFFLKFSEGTDQPAGAVRVRVEGHDATKPSFDRFVPVLNADGQPGLADLQDWLGIAAGPTGAASRIFVRGVSTAAAARPLPTPWLQGDVAIEITKRWIHPKNPPPDPSDPMPVPCLEAMVEQFEHPMHVEFAALDFDAVAAEAGRLSIVEPQTDSSLAELVDDPAKALALQPDDARRTAVRLRWSARPERLAAAGDPTSKEELRRVIGGFDLFELDPESLPREANEDAATIEARYAAHARSVGRVQLLPESLRGLEPAEVGDFEKLECRYPSRARRRRPPDGKGNKRAWFSAAESVLVWPDRIVRRSLLSAPDEEVIAALFAAGRPDQIQVSIVGWPEKGGTPVANFIDRYADLPIEQSVDSDNRRVSFQRPRDEMQHLRPFEPHMLRALLRGLIWTDSGGGATADRWVRDEAGRLEGVTVVVEALRFGSRAKPSVVASEKIFFDPAAQVHPMVADTLDELRYDAYEQTSSKTPGRIYRRYEVVPEEQPPLAPEASARTFEAWLDQTPAERDPCGWGILRTLGLAVGFKLYDTETGAYLTGRKLAWHLHRSFDRVLSRYRDLFELQKGGPRAYRAELGAPFVDLLIQPQGLLRVSSFDGGVGDLERPKSFLDDESLALVQIALRPVPDRWASLADAPVRYVSFNASQGARLPVVAGALGEGVIVDILRSDLHTAQSATFASEKLAKRTGEAPPDSHVVEREARQAIARVTAIEPVQDWNALLDGIFGKADLEQPNKPKPWTPIDAPGDYAAAAPEAFERFGALAEGRVAAWWFPETPPQQGSALAKRSLLAFLSWAFARFPYKLPTKVEDQRLLARKLAAWGARFLEQGADREHPIDRISFSLATVTRALPWRVVPESDGAMTLVLFEKDRFGRRRRYAVRPFGRYEAFAQAGGYKSNRTLRGAFGNNPEDIWADVTIPRTEPLTKPVILSATRTDGIDERGLKPGRSLELVVARPADEIVADANTVTDAGLSPHGVAVGFWREFPHIPWARGLVKELDPLPQIGALQVPTELPKVWEDDRFGEHALAELRTRVPDAWRGALVFRTKGLPYFYRIRALVHASAGVVVSEPSLATFEEGYYELHWPWENHLGQKRNEQTDPPDQVAKKEKELTQPPWWDVERTNTEVRVVFEIPLVRFVDCMDAASARLWLDGCKGPRALNLPEPGVSYQIVVATPDGGSSSAEIEVLPVLDGAAAARYSTRGLGTRLVVTGDVPPTEEASQTAWKILLEAKPVPQGTSLPKPLFESPPDLLDEMDGLVVKEQATRGWEPVAPRSAATVTLTRPVVSNHVRDWGAFANKLIEERDLYQRYPCTATDSLVPELMAFIEGAQSADPDGAWNASGNQDSKQIPVADWLFGLPRFDPSAYASLSVGQWAWPHEPPRNRRQRRAVEDAFGTDQLPESLKDLRRALRAYFVRLARWLDEQPFVDIRPLVGRIPESEQAAFELVQPGWLADSLDVAVERMLEPTGLPTQDQLDAAFAPFEGERAGAAAIEALGRVEDAISQAEVGAVALLIPIRSDAALDGPLRAIGTLGEATPRTATVRTPPTRTELAALQSDVVRARFAALAAAQIFGPERRPFLAGFKGIARPARHPIDRRG